MKRERTLAWTFACLTLACVFACSDGEVEAKTSDEASKGSPLTVVPVVERLAPPGWRFADPSYYPLDSDAFEHRQTGLRQRFDRAAIKLRVRDFDTFEALFAEEFVGESAPWLEGRPGNRDRASFLAELEDLVRAWRRVRDVQYEIRDLRFGADDVTTLVLDLSIGGMNAMGELAELDARSRIRLQGNPMNEFHIDRWEWLDASFRSERARFALHHHDVGLHPVDSHEERATADGAGFGSLAVGDVDLDGAFDVFAPGLNSSSLFLRRRRGFVDEASDRGLGGLRGATSGVFCDLDGDRSHDLVVTSLGHEGLLGKTHGEPNRAFKNRAGIFVNAFPTLTHYLPSYCAVPFDADLDGDLDIFLCGYGRVDDAGHPGHATGARDRLLENDGAGTFRDISLEVGFTQPSLTRTALIVDHDMDGDLDIYTVNERREDALWSRDSTTGTYKNLARRRTWASSTRPDSFACLDDLNGDGRIELLGDMCVDRHSECVLGTLDIGAVSRVGEAPVTAAVDEYDPLWSGLVTDLDLDGRAELLTITRSEIDHQGEHT